MIKKSILKRNFCKSNEPFNKSNQIFDDYCDFEKLLKIKKKWCILRKKLFGNIYLFEIQPWALI